MPEFPDVEKAKAALEFESLQGIAAGEVTAVRAIETALIFAGGPWVRDLASSEGQFRAELHTLAQMLPGMVRGLAQDAQARQAQSIKALCHIMNAPPRARAIQVTLPEAMIAEYLGHCEHCGDVMELGKASSTEDGVTCVECATGNCRHENGVCPDA